MVDYKNATVSLTFTTGTEYESGNDRPVSLISVVGNISETIVREELFKHLDKNLILSKKQLGLK